MAKKMMREKGMGAVMMSTNGLMLWIIRFFPWMEKLRCMLRKVMISESTWRLWFADTISSSMQVRDFVGDAVINSLTEYGDGLKQTLDEGKAYIKTISEETKDDVFSLIGFEVGRQTEVLEEKMERDQKEFEVRMGEQLNVHREVQQGLDVQGS